MSTFIIEDGGITASKARVTKEGRIMAESVSRAEASQAGELGNSFNVNTGTISLTTANKSSVLFLKNTGSDQIIISSLVYLIGNSTGGAGDMEVSIVKNPTAGTIITNGVPPAINSNKNYGSSNTPDAVIFIGQEGATITTGLPSFASLLAGAARSYIIATGDIVIPKGASIGIEVTPQTGNTAMNLQIAISMHTRPVT